MTVINMSRLLIALGYSTMTGLLLYGVHRVKPSERPLVQLGAGMTTLWAGYFWYLFIVAPNTHHNYTLARNLLHIVTLTFVAAGLWKRHRDYLRGTL